MDLFEFQAKELLRKFEVPVPEGRVAATPEEAAEAASGLGGHVQVKAQVQTGGRGKAGGIKPASSPEEARDVASQILGMKIPDQGAKGVFHTVKRVLIERNADIAESTIGNADGAQYYCAFLVDRSNRNFMGMMSAKGGMNIEEVAETDPKAIAMVHIDPLLGMSDFHARELAYGSGIDEAARAEAIQILPKLYRAFVASDATLVEVNPLILTGGGRVMALDGKVSLDDSAAYRHPNFEELKSAHEIPEQERVAKEKGLNFIKLDGDVGIIGNGAGLVMSTLDVVKAAGGSAANFLDVGGGAGAELLSNALEVIMSNPEVKSVLINIFGGITRCDLVAEGIIDALGRLDVKVPIVVRLDGTNAEQGRKMLAEAPHPMLKSADTMLGAAKMAVELAHAPAGGGA
ncbi:MAG TPA: ADP-forming succinate--CoA ligase subunit beta [Actinomycetota bacterium]|nr:ADP-forming succinate--CoA ligase subunit beta [Actinomycetota bacterium]